MQSLEEQVRQAVINRKTDEISRRLQEPRYQRMFQAMFGQISDELYTAFRDTEFGTARLTDEEVREYLTTCITPENLQEIIKKNLRNSYITTQELEDCLEKLPEEIRTAWSNIIPCIREYVDYSTRILTGLASIAQEHGISYAASQEAEEIALREIFPVESGYHAFVHEGVKVKEHMARVTAELAENKIVENHEFQFLEGIKRYISRIYYLTQIKLDMLFIEIEKQLLLDKIERMYGN